MRAKEHLRAAPDAVLSEPLTDRERELLAYLPTRLTNAELAARFFVSVNTIKTHMAHIYRKLDAAEPQRRCRAGDRARPALSALPRRGKAKGRPTPGTAFHVSIRPLRGLLDNRRLCAGLRLAAEPETLDQRAVTRDVDVLEVAEQTTALTDHAGTDHDASGGRACAPSGAL